MQAGRLLMEMGYRDVLHYAGGMEDWTAHRMPLDPPSQAVRVRVPVGRRRVVDRFGDLEVGHLALAWVCMVAGFGLLYFALGLIPHQGLIENNVPVGGGLHGLIVSLYFSAVTATSIGYGDVVPVGVLRLLAVAEAIFELLIFGMLVSKFVSRRQEELLVETHSTLFEARLARLRTSLHMVLMELQTISDMCGRNDVPAGRLMHRVESASTLFAGELRAIHDLLYRPTETPDESALLGILGSLQGGMEELVNVLTCLPAQEPRGSGFLSTLTVVARLSGEICGECVPVQYADELRTQMDRIQSLGHQLRGVMGGAH